MSFQWILKFGKWKIKNKNYEQFHNMDLENVCSVGSSIPTHIADYWQIIQLLKWNEYVFSIVIRLMLMSTISNCVLLSIHKHRMYIYLSICLLVCFLFVCVSSRKLNAFIILSVFSWYMLLILFLSLSLIDSDKKKLN